jgi:hypothetical protein
VRRGRAPDPPEERCCDGGGLGGHPLGDVGGSARRVASLVSRTASLSPPWADRDVAMSAKPTAMAAEGLASGPRIEGLVLGQEAKLLPYAAWVGPPEQLRPSSGARGARYGGWEGRAWAARRRPPEGAGGTSGGHPACGGIPALQDGRGRSKLLPYPDVRVPVSAPGGGGGEWLVRRGRAPDPREGPVSLCPSGRDVAMSAKPTAMAAEGLASGRPPGRPSQSG